MPRPTRAPVLPLLVLCFALLLVFTAACGGGDGDTKDDGTDTTDGTDNGDDEVAECGLVGSNYVRCEVHEYDQAWIDDYRSGVALMMTRATTDPTSWRYQANIHGVPGSPFNTCPVETTADQTAWATCQHGQFFFLAWHRMYLYYFERVVRAAVDEATNGQRTDWTLPYWDYEQFHPLPDPFRVPADSSNSLFVAERAGNCNNGSDTCVTASTASATQALATVPVCSCPDTNPCDGCIPGLQSTATFHGGFVSAATHFGGFTGELEAQPHNVVHNAVGGSGGWMADADCAARDPIFWLHHANIDRLWQVWLNQNPDRVNPIGSTTWRDEVFTFFDVENGATVERQLTGCDILDMVTQLDYAYQDLPVLNVVACGGPQPATAGAAGVGEKKVLATQKPDKPVALGRERASLAVKVPVSATASVGENEEYRVVLEDLELVAPGAFYQVYLNLPEGTEPDPEGPYFIGNLALFGHTAQQLGEGHEPVHYSRSFDISDKVREWSARGEWSGDVNLTFVRGNPAPATAAAEPGTFIRLGKMSVEHRN